MKFIAQNSLEDEVNAIYGEWEMGDPGSFEERAILIKLLRFSEGFNDLSGASQVFKEDFWKASTCEEISRCFNNFYENCLYFSKKEDERNYAPSDLEDDMKFLTWRNL